MNVRALRRRADRKDGDVRSLEARSDRAQVMYAYSSSCQLRHFQLRHCIVNDVISTGVVLSLSCNICDFITHKCLF